MLNASVGVQRVMGRLRRPRSLGSDPATELHARSLAAARVVRGGWRSLTSVGTFAPSHQRRTFQQAARRDATAIAIDLGHDRILGIAVAAILLIASLISVSVGSAHPKGPTGGTNGNGSPARIAAGGAAGLDHDDSLDGAPADLASAGGSDGSGPTSAFGGASLLSPDDQASLGAQGDTSAETVEGPYLEDGTLLKPVFVDTSIEDGSGLLRTYKVKSGDTLTGIARKFHVSMMTLWWANKLDSKDQLHQGQVLAIPPVSGLVVTVTSSDTLDSLATKHKVDKQDILDANGLDDPNLVVGQVLVIPGAKGKPIPTPKPTKRPVVKHTSSGGGNGGSGGEAHYSGGSLLWPVVGGGNYISQYFHYGHYALDIAADYGTRVRAAAGGRVVFSGWKNNGGGYQVWISHGSGTYTTYNHMSAITVSNGESVGRGEQVGRVGQTGNATGPHLHFEVWRGGEPWNGGTRVNPLPYF